MRKSLFLYCFLFFLNLFSTHSYGKTNYPLFSNYSDVSRYLELPANKISEKQLYLIANTLVYQPFISFPVDERIQNIRLNTGDYGNKIKESAKKVFKETDLDQNNIITKDELSEAAVDNFFKWDINKSNGLDVIEFERALWHAYWFQAANGTNTDKFLEKMRYLYSHSKFKIPNRLIFELDKLAEKERSKKRQFNKDLFTFLRKGLNEFQYQNFIRAIKFRLIKGGQYIAPVQSRRAERVMENLIRFDNNSDRTISGDELASLINYINHSFYEGKPKSYIQVLSYISYLDINNNGLIEKFELGGFSDEVLLNYDLDNDKVIDSDELSNLMDLRFQSFIDARLKLFKDDIDLIVEASIYELEIPDYKKDNFLMNFYELRAVHIEEMRNSRLSYIEKIKEGLGEVDYEKIVNLYLERYLKIL
ncbi:hypothetical protein GV054_17560 [Marinomonas mediterranea]|uniref:hypothetical protein n=1 Tax=Marinomonas mediterranea TaxID=119864 RepID=UPI00234A13DD|nr:hypothetical protein [Marinomonas mediterranea]WCN14684.1 hypothetical protein GV054_17560 [Marinomonas mediterranea]